MERGIERERARERKRERERERACEREKERDGRGNNLMTRNLGIVVESKAAAGEKKPLLPP